MFTGIVEELGEILALQHARESIILVIKGNKVLEDLKEGDSIAVNGVCLTAVKVSSSAFSADVMPETLRKTNLYELKKGDKVNLERALPVGGRLGGHFVSGHIDGTGTIISEKKEGNAQIKLISAPPQVIRYIVPKGSVAVDGISLTVVDVDEESFSVSLIPHTAKFTTLGFKKTGDKVNLEADLLGKYVEKLFLSAEKENFFSLEGNKNNKGDKEGITYNFLKEKGFF